MLKDIRKNIKELEDDLMPNDSIFNEEDVKMDGYKRLLRRLSVEDRTILLLYMELGSLRAVANILGVSHTLVFKKIKEIRSVFV